jgi:hypothetical protein
MVQVVALPFALIGVLRTSGGMSDHVRLRASGRLSRSAPRTRHPTASRGGLPRVQAQAEPTATLSHASKRLRLISQT